jgi:dCTP deaminase
MILTDREIQISLDQNLIQIEPRPLEKAYSSTTVDLTLDENINEFKSSSTSLEMVINPSDAAYKHEEVLGACTMKLKIPADGYVFKPKALLLAWTAEYVNLSIHARIAARVEGKSSLARLGIGVHITAPIIHAGFEGNIRLEMVNHGSLPVRLMPGMPICQLVFEQTLGTPVRGYKGRFSGQLASTNRM